MKDIIKKSFYIFLFILCMYYINRLSKNYNENFNDFINYDKSSLADLIKVETERCKAINVCGFYNGKQIPCKFTTCEDTCVCKSNPKDKKENLKKLLNL